MTPGDGRHIGEQRLESSKRKEEGSGGKGAAVGQVKWRVPAGFYAALATGPPCLSATFRSPTFYFYRLPAFRVPVSSRRRNLLSIRSSVFIDISPCFQPHVYPISQICVPCLFFFPFLQITGGEKKIEGNPHVRKIYNNLSISSLPPLDTPNWTSSCKNYNSSTPGAWSRAINLPSQSKRNPFGCLSRLRSRPGGRINLSFRPEERKKEERKYSSGSGAVRLF